jgi:hypothetical protein
MDTVLRYRGIDIASKDIDFIQKLINQNPQVSRWKLSRLLCLARQWVQPNGALRDMVCRGLMLELHRTGHISLPPIKKQMFNPFIHRKRPSAINVDMTEMTGRISDLHPLVIYQVRRTKHEQLFNSLIEMYHYLGYTQPVGEHLKYIIFSHDRPIACFSWSSAPRHIKPRDQFIGWTADIRRQHLHLMAYNSRFLILPYVKIPHLASHLLGQITRRLSSDWNQLYHHPIYYVETFIDPSLYRGVCYYAANWIKLGQTTGRGKNSQTKRANRTLKDVLGYPLCKRFRRHLGVNG